MNKSKYKGLFIPEAKEKEDEDMEDIQFSYCGKSKCTEKKRPDCSKCLFWITNLDKFTEWYKEKKERKLLKQKGLL